MDASTLVCRELREIAREIALLNQEVQLLRDTLIGLATDRKTEPKRGKWLERNSGFTKWIRCSVCDHKFYQGSKTNFCPNCGADMRGSENG